MNWGLSSIKNKVYLFIYVFRNDKNAMFNVTNATVYSTTNYKTFFQFGYYDAPLSAPVYPIKVGQSF